jgi:hypothetical protein
MWRSLVETYAIRAREFAEEAARLGGPAHYDQAYLSPEVLEQWEEIKRRYKLCGAAGDELDQYIEASAHTQVTGRLNDCG